MRVGGKGLWLAGALFLSGCVGDDFGPGRSGVGAGLTSEQRWHLREASRRGEHELLIALSRMIWETPDRRGALASYAVSLRPESTAALEAAAAR